MYELEDIYRIYDNDQGVCFEVRPCAVFVRNSDGKMDAIPVYYLKAFI